MPTSQDGGMKMNGRLLTLLVVRHSAESKLGNRESAENESENDKDLPDHKEEEGLICFGESMNNWSTYYIYRRMSTYPLGYRDIWMNKKPRTRA
jgi:hypothetical protein